MTYAILEVLQELARTCHIPMKMLQQLGRTSQMQSCMPTKQCNDLYRQQNNINSTTTRLWPLELPTCSSLWKRPSTPNRDKVTILQQPTYTTQMDTTVATCNNNKQNMLWVHTC